MNVYSLFLTANQFHTINFRATLWSFWRLGERHSKSR